MFIRSDNEYGHLNLNGVQPWETGFWIYHYFGPQPLTPKAPITTAADDIHKYFFIVFQRK